MYRFLVYINMRVLMRRLSKIYEMYVVRGGEHK